MKFPSHKAGALASLLLMVLLGGGAMLLAIARLQQDSLKQTMADRTRSTRMLLDRSLHEQSRSMISRLQGLIQNESVEKALRRGDAERLQFLAKTVSPDLAEGRVAFEFHGDATHTRLLRVDGDGVKPSGWEGSDTGGVALLQGEAWLYLEPSGEPILRYRMAVKSSEETVGYVELSKNIAPLLEDLEKILALRLLVLVDKEGLSRVDWEGMGRDDTDAGQSWERFPNFVIWGSQSRDLLDALSGCIAGQEMAGGVRVDGAGRIFCGRLMDLGLSGTKPGGRVLALMDAAQQRDEGQRVLWWSGAAALGFGGLLFVHLLASFLPLERRASRAQRMLRDRKSFLEQEVERRTQQMTTVNSRLQKEVHVRNQTEQKLLRNQMFLLTVLDSLAYPFVVVDARDFSIKLANKAAIQHAATSDSVQSCHSLIYGLDHPCLGKEMPCVLREIHRLKRPVMVEHRCRNRDDETMVYEVHAYPIASGHGEVEQIIEYFIDITERKRAEDALNASEHNYRELVETANSIVLRWDPQGIIRFINDFGSRFFGYASGELSGRPLIGTIVPVSESSGRDMAAMLADIILRPDKYQNNENENMRKDGERVWVSWANKVIFDAAGNVVEVLSFGNDITQRRRAMEALGESEERFRNIYENSPVMMHTLDESGRIISVNRKWVEETGYAREEVVGRPLTSLMTAESASWSSIDLFPDLLHQGQLKDVAFQFVRKGGAVIDILMDCSLSADPKGQVTSLAALQNVSERRRTEQEMQLAASVFENSIEGILVTDAQARILRTNRAFTLVTGYSAGEAVGRNPALLASGKHDAMFFQGMWSALRENGFWQGEIWNRRKNGEVYPEWLGISTVYDERRQPIYFVGVFTDITDQKLSEQRIYHLAHYDALTDLPNRVLFQDRLDRALVAAKRAGYPLPMLYLDLDRFKPINDSFGHPVGDLLLQQVAQRLRQCVRESDTVARMGGDEFTVILGPGGIMGGGDVVQSGSRVARAILDALAAPFDLDGHEAFISASIGIVVYPQDGGDVAELVKNADTAMYHAKIKGRNNFLFYETHMNATAADRLLIENNLRRALERSEFELYFQPSVNIREGRIDALEALIRWRHPELGMVPPDQFVYLAEENGLIVPIGEWVLREAVRQVGIWREAGFAHLRVAVNLSLRQFRHRDLMNVIRQVVLDAELDASVLALEVTESAFMEDEEETIARLDEMSEMGIQILIDDFGTGYSSLARLRVLPIHVLKIDRSFVRDITTDPNDASIISAIIAMAHNLQLKVIAEGVETESQLKFLQARDCEEVQGYLFSKPIPANEVVALLKKGITLPD